MAGDELVGRGWRLTDHGIQECTEDGNKRIDVIIKNALNTDLREIGGKWVPEELIRGKLDYIQGPVVLQLSKMKNIAAPKDNEESQGAPRMMKLVLTDGHTSCTAVETEALKNMGFSTPPGSKILIEGTVDVECNILLLNNKNTRFLGGRVEKLAENWELKRSLKYQSRSNVRSEGGPPPYVPFGQKLTSQLPNPRKDNFKSLDSKDKGGGENNEFQQQRQATIAEVLQAKDSKAKIFGGGGKLALGDNDIAKIVDMGFSMEDASNALRFSNGNVNDAIHNLLSKGNNSRGRPHPEKQDRPPDRNEKNERNDRFDRKDKLASRPKRGGNASNTEELSANSQPSGPSTLFDFLTNKIPVKEEPKTLLSSNNNQKPQGRFGAEHNKTNLVSSSQTTSNYNNKPLINRTKPHYETNNNQDSSKSHASYDNYNTRRQNVPPRFAQKYGKDMPEGQLYSGQSNSFNTDSENYERTRQKRHENYRNDFNEGSRDSSYRSQNKYSQDSRRSDTYDQCSENNSRSSGDNKKYASETSKSNALKYSKDGGNKSETDRTSNSQQQNNRYPNSKWETTRSIVPAWNKGDVCIAKYWEDKQFYPAVIEAIAPNGMTCVVTFPEYGNQEEVLCSDMMQMPSQSWNDVQQPISQVQYSAPPQFYPNQMPVCPPYQPDQYLPQGQFTMEFRRGGSGPQFKQKPDKTRPTQQFYQPPSNKSYQ